MADKTMAAAVRLQNRVLELSREVERLRDWLDWIYAVPEDPANVQRCARIALDTERAFDDQEAKR